MARRKSAVKCVLQGLCIYGGLLATRQEVMEDLQRLRGRNGETLSWLMVDRLTWMPKDATAEVAKHLRSCGLTLKQVRESE